ncbi:MAG: carbamoyltransferase HypF [Sphingobacteriales bacterium]
METYHIHINGIVQGVGFRPMVYHLARELDLKGYVKNDSNGINIFFNAAEDGANSFFEKIKLAAPQNSKVISARLVKTAEQKFTDFSIIVEDDDMCQKQVLLSPDMAVCPGCLAELHNVNNRRYRYPFITCTQCGPRYSIIGNVPYERHATTMQGFSMCKTCAGEYSNVEDRRFFSQTNSCTDCGIRLGLYQDASTKPANNTETVLSAIKNLLVEGKILAVKGIGGYILICDANNPHAIRLLRGRKHRPTKPFAVLYPDIESVENSFELSEQEKTLLESTAAPIVLLYPKQAAFTDLAVSAIAPGLKRIGVMIPYNPLFDLIARDFGKPLIATSANISGSPIIYKDEDALDYLFDIADYVVTHDREIIIPQDDSVVQVSKYTKQTIVLRRSRGYAPSFISYKPKSSQCILSAGAFLKSSFTLAVNGNIFVSQFLGSGESFESQLMYRHTLEHWLNMYAVRPDVIIADKHPGYFSRQYARELAEEFEVDLKLVQHHEAHFAAVLAENNLLHKNEPVLGVIWDGTGFGNDGNIWGGEFFNYENNEIRRINHFDYFPTIAGDKTALEPRIAALCALHEVPERSTFLKEKFTSAEWNNYRSLIKTANLFTSSAGRIFDAVASMLGICDKQTYEGEAAMYLQTLAEDYVAENGLTMDGSYFTEGVHLNRVHTAVLMRGIMLDIENGKAGNYIAAKFHYSLVCLIGSIAIDVNYICFSGGVFQNALLVDWVKNKYAGKYQLYFHRELSPNDENISFGQMVYYENNITTAPVAGQVKRNKPEADSDNDPKNIKKIYDSVI